MPRHSDLTGSNLHYARVRVGSGDPNGNVTATIKGEIYIDETSGTSYYSTDTGNNHWQSFGGGGSNIVSYTLDFNYTDISNDGSNYYVKTKMPMYTDKDFIALYDDGNLIDNSSWNFGTMLGRKMGTVDDLTDTIILDMSAVSGSSLRVVYREELVPFVPFFYLARSDGHVVNDIKPIDAWADLLGGINRRTSLSWDSGTWTLSSQNPNTTYYVPDQLVLAAGTDFSNNSWRLEMYSLGRVKHGSGVGATTGHKGTGSGPRSKGLRTVVPFAKVDAGNGVFDLSSIMVRAGHISNIFVLRLRDINTNRVSLFGIQKVRFKDFVGIKNRDSGDVYYSVRCDLVF